MTVCFDKDKDRWRYDFIRDGQRYRGYCLDKNGVPVKSRRAATESEAVARRAIGEAKKHLPNPGTTTLGEIVRDLVRGWKTEPYWPTRRRHVVETLKFFGPETPVAGISEARIDDFKQHLLEQPMMIWAGGAERDASAPENEKFWKKSDRMHSPSTVNRYLQVIRGVFKRAHKMRDPITRERVLVDLPDITDLDELKRKPRPIPEPVLTRLFEILPQHVIEATAVSLLFGFRKGEVFGLKRDKVDFDAKGVWLDAAEVKDDEDDFLPGSELAMEYLGRLASQAEERGVDHLITWKRPRTNKLLERWEPIKRPKTAWKTAMRKIEAEFGRRYRFHDVRAAFLTHIAETVGPLAAQKMGRHSEYRTTERYVSLGDAQKRKAASAASDRNSLKLIIGGKA